MSILSNNQKGGKKGAKGAKKNVPNAVPAVKAGKSGGFNKKPIKTGGTRGS